jgi:hypothetical protein
MQGPQDCFLTLRGIKTLHVRMQRHCENAHNVANFLNNHEMVEKVYWPRKILSNVYLDPRFLALPLRKMTHHHHPLLSLPQSM